MGRAVLACVVGLVLWVPTTGRGADGPASEASRLREIAPRGPLEPEERRTIGIFEEAAPSVVFVTTLAVRLDLFTLNQLEQPRGTGSGFLWDDLGHVVTNAHVVAGADRYVITLSDRTTWEAVRVGADTVHDLAVLRIEGAPRERLRPLPLGTSADLAVGQSVLAIGNPFGFDRTLTTGVISALDREIVGRDGQRIRELIQTDAAINPGNSGGPLLDSAGRLIGVNTAIYSPSGAYAGIGFAVPVDVVHRSVADLVVHGRVIRPTLGVVLASDQVARRWGLEGLLVLDVATDGPAARAGVQPARRDRYGRIVLGDQIVAVAGQPVRARSELLDVLEEYEAGDTVVVSLRRGRRTIEREVTLEVLR